MNHRLECTYQKLFIATNNRFSDSRRTFGRFAQIKKRHVWRRRQRYLYRDRVAKRRDLFLTNDVSSPRPRVLEWYRWPTISFYYCISLQETYYCVMSSVIDSYTILAALLQLHGCDTQVVLMSKLHCIVNEYSVEELKIFR